jgi:thiol:disulfide interchange protein DsbD
MLGVVIWLLGVYGGAGEEAARITAMGGFLLVLAVSCWIYSLGRRKAVTWSMIAVLLAGGYWLFLRPDSRHQIPWEPWSEIRVADANSNGQAVFVDFTAQWCPNCHAIEDYVLETDPVRTALREKNILPLKADWTRKDPIIGAELKKYGSNSLPSYLLCVPGESQCRVLPHILTQEKLIAEFNQLP